jgi:X-X-X-Leu-X-X-Gly heptad repeat protein
MTDTTIIVTQPEAPTVITSAGEQGPPGTPYASAAAQAATEAARDATIARAALTAADVLLTQDDATQTALDRIATAADRVQTGLDSLATGADRVQTGLDKVATGADRVQTGLDRTQTGLDLDATAADVVQTGLDAAATGADVVLTHADVLLTHADVVLTHADADQTALDVIATGADRTQTGLDKIATAADRVQTGLDRTQTGLDRTAAAASANAAAASLDTFDDRFLGAKAVAPTLDNDGNALLTGALYWDTELGALRVWTGAAWTNTTELDDRVLADQQLLGGISYVTDMALKVVADVNDLKGTVGSTERGELMILALSYLLDLAGVTARAIGGGDVLLRAGTAALPSLMPTGDTNTGLFFPAADTLAAATAGVERWRVDANGYHGFATSTPTGVMDINDNKARIRTARTPASATAAGNAGEFCWDASFFYICTSTNVWRRTAHATW